MARFQRVTETFLFRKLLEFWGNVVRNYDGDCQNNGFFFVVVNRFDSEKATELLLDAYTSKELETMRNDQLLSGKFESCGVPKGFFKAAWNSESGRDRCRIVLGAIVGYLCAECGVRQDDALERKFGELKRVFKLSDLEAEIALLTYVYSETSFDWPCKIGDREKPLYYAMALDRSYGEVRAALTANGRLRRFDILDRSWDFNRQSLGSFMDGSEDEAITRRFYKECDLHEALPWDFYGDLATRDGAIISRMLAANEGKCNILLYGAPGTGKTSFAHALCKKLGRRAFEVRQDGEDGLKSGARKIGIQVANEQEDSSGAVLIVDEADELLRGNSGGLGLFGGDLLGRTEKGEMNLMLDDMRIPAIWISNVPADTMDESVRRRFDYSVRFEGLNEAQRTMVWRNLVKKLGLGELISEMKLAEYAAAYETSAGGVAIVLENLKRMKPATNEVDDLIKKLMIPHCELMGVRSSDGMLPAKEYSLDGLNIKGKVGPEKIVRAARNFLSEKFNASTLDRPRLNVLLFGPPGTGKTEFVKYLGRALDRKVLVKRASDILDMYVGNTEKRISAMFRQAESEHAILFLDEIDGLAQDREDARRGWQVTQVDELLQEMENFNGVMIAATNFSKNLDAAIMRRFTFKLEFDYLDDNGKKLFFERMFKSELKPEEFVELKRLSNLAPGDFRTVRQEQFYLGEGQTNFDRIAALQEECAAKKDGNRFAKIGFAA